MINTAVGFRNKISQGGRMGSDFFQAPISRSAVDDDQFLGLVILLDAAFQTAVQRCGRIFHRNHDRNAGRSRHPPRPVCHGPISFTGIGLKPAFSALESAGSAKAVAGGAEPCAATVKPGSSSVRLAPIFCNARISGGARRSIGPERTTRLPQIAFRRGTPKPSDSMWASVG